MSQLNWVLLQNNNIKTGIEFPGTGIQALFVLHLNGVFTICDKGRQIKCSYEITKQFSLPKQYIRAIIVII